jgi:hypothetical protein
LQGVKPCRGTNPGMSPRESGGVTNPQGDDSSPKPTAKAGKRRMMVGMRRIPVLGIALTLFLVLVSAAATPALAKPKMVFVGSFGGAPVLVHEGMMVEFMDFRESPCGRADMLMISIMVNEEEVPVCAVTDNEDLGYLLDEMFAGMVPIIVVEDDELEVWRKGRTLFAELTVEAGPIHPVYAEFKGCSGKPEKGMESETMPNGWEMTMTYIGYEAAVSFVYDETPCPPTVGMVGPQFLLKITPP